MVFDIFVVFGIDYLFCNIEIFSYFVLDVLDNDIDKVDYDLVSSVILGSCYVDFYTELCFF